MRGSVEGILGALTIDFEDILDLIVTESLPLIVEVRLNGGVGLRADENNDSR